MKEEYEPEKIVVIPIKNKTRRKLYRMKRYRESYDSLISRLIKGEK